MIDSHIHLYHHDYEDDLNEVVETAKQNGVKQVILVGCGGHAFETVFEMQETDPDFYNVSLGWHPVDVSEFEEKYFDMMIEACKKKTIIAIGEIGLDYYWHPEEKPEQVELFKRQIELAKLFNLPIIVHARDSYEDCYEILREYQPISGVMHSFAADGMMAQKFVDIGMEIGLSGPITFKNGHAQKDVAATIALDKLHIETDGPYLTPAPFRGKRNRPEYIEYVAQEIAFIKGISVEDVKVQTEINTNRLFNLKGEKLV